MSDYDTIVAQATPPGRGGISIVRVSGAKVQSIAQAIIKKIPTPRLAEHHHFKDQNNDLIDMGIVLYFPAPHSFTGEEVLEFQGHGSPIVVDRLIASILQAGARIAKPGEFSLRAFLNSKIDLTQAEAIADLIDSASQQAARLALRSLQGEFSRHIQSLLDAVIKLRTYVEAAIDFPEEEIDFLSDGKVEQDLNALLAQVEKIHQAAVQGASFREAKTAVIVGPANVGKSTLLNRLSGRASAIVTEVAGTTRDLIREHILLDGVAMTVVDTAGLRESTDPIEQEGMARTWQQIETADIVLLVSDICSQHEEAFVKIKQQLTQRLDKNSSIIMIFNKLDLTTEIEHEDGVIYLSAKTGQGLSKLYEHLKSLTQNNIEGCFIARRRHLDALEKTQQALLSGYQQFQGQCAGELLAEELRIAQQALGEITGQFSADDLLGKIFSEFCVGK
ncbi:MAG: tRNA uridine-5-carboxymethylaminomethyl(34) synthesis GTPase MnmE [Gammaproteobacteria bacterium]